MDYSQTPAVVDFFLKYPSRQYASGDILLRAGEAPTEIYYIESGSVCVYDITSSGNEVILNVFRRPAFFSISWLFSQGGNRFYFEVVETSRLRAAPIQDVLDLLHREPSAAMDLLKRIGRGLDGIYLRLGAHMSHNAQQQLAVELLINARRFGKKSPNGTVLKISTSDLATNTGLARETISRQLSSLIKLGLISRIGRSICINDEQKLASYTELQ